MTKEEVERASRALNRMRKPPIVYGLNRNEARWVIGKLMVLKDANTRLRELVEAAKLGMFQTIMGRAWTEADGPIPDEVVLAWRPGEVTEDVLKWAKDCFMEGHRNEG